MFVKHLQQYLDRFTGDQTVGKGNAVSNARVYMHVNGHLEEIKRIEVQESNIIGDIIYKSGVKTTERTINYSS